MEGNLRWKRALAASIVALALGGTALLVALPSDEARKVSEESRNVTRDAESPSKSGTADVVRDLRVDAAAISAAPTRGFADEELSTAAPRPVVERSKIDKRTRPGGRRSWSAFARIPGRGLAYTFPALRKPAGEERRVETDAIQLPPSCTVRVCTEDATIEGREVSTPGSEPRSVSTPAIEVPGRCAGVVCIGSFSVRSVHVISTPGSKPRLVSTPEVRIPAACRAAQSACMGPTEVPGQTILVVPASAERGITEAITVSVSFESLDVGLAPAVGSYDTVGPFVFPVNVPEIGVIEITLCPDGCATPRTTNGAMHGRLQVAVSHGDDTHGGSVPVDREW